MMDEIIPDEHNVSRYCPAKKLNDDLTRPTPAAFLPRPGEPYLSVNWLEFFQLPFVAEQLAKVRQALKSKLELRRSARLAVLGVGPAKRMVATQNINGPDVEFRHRPDEPDPDPSHAGIFNVAGAEDLRIAAALADAVHDIHPAIK